MDTANQEKLARAAAEKIEVHFPQLPNFAAEVIKQIILDAHFPEQQAVCVKRAHVEGCPKALSVPVDLCMCGGGDVVFPQEAVPAPGEVLAGLSAEANAIYVPENIPEEFKERFWMLRAHIDEALASPQVAENPVEDNRQ